MRKWMFSNRYGLTEAVKSGRKTMTRRSARRVVEQYEICQELTSELFKPTGRNESLKEYALRVCPIKVGEIIAVAESYEDARVNYIAYEDDGSVCHDLHANQTKGWRNKMFVRADLMPTRVKVTGIGFERLQDISDDDCLREIGYENNHESNYFKHVIKDGTVTNWFYSPVVAFAFLIDKVSGKGTWQSNEYHYVYSFELVK